MQISTSEVISVIALALSAANFIIARKTTRRELERKTRDDLIKIQLLLDESFDLLYGRSGFSRSRSSTKLLEAEKRIEQAIAIDATHPRAIEYQGHLHECRGNILEARKCYQASIAQNPNRSRPHNCLGLLAEPTEAVSHFERAIELSPDSASPFHYNLAKAFVKLARPADAEENFKKALQQHPHYADAHDEFADLLLKAGRKQEAIGHYEAAISADATHANAMTGLGRLLSESDETWGQALTWLEHAHRVDPTNPYPLRMLAAVYADKHQPDKALAIAEKAIDLDPTERLSGATMADLITQMQRELANNKTNTAPPDRSAA